MKCENCKKLEQQITEMERRFLAEMAEVKMSAFQQPVPRDVLKAIGHFKMLASYFSQVSTRRVEPITAEELKASIKEWEAILGYNPDIQRHPIGEIERFGALFTDEAKEFIRNRLMVLEGDE